jgi:hypothetical protein
MQSSNIEQGIMKKDKSVIWAVSVILLYSLLNIIVLIHHEPWEDEAQAWLIARDLDIISIFKQMAYEGTPALWHILLFPLAKAGLPYISEFILHLVIAITTVTVFVLYAPFSRLTKVLFIFSYYMAYEYSIIARSYSLSVLLLFLIAALYVNRFEYPIRYSILVFLLFNTNVHSFFIAFSLTVLFAWELHRNEIKGVLSRIGVSVMLTGGFWAFLQLLSPPDNFTYGIFSENKTYLAPFAAIAYAFFPWHTINFLSVNLRLIFIVISFLIFYTIILSVLRKPAVLFILVISFSGLFYIFALKYTGAVRHYGLILIIFLFAIWISKYYSDSQIRLLEVSSNINLSKLSIAIINSCLALSLLYALEIQYLDYKYTFSGAKGMADFIKRNHLTDHIIVSHSMPGVITSLLPYLPGKKFWYADIENFGTLGTYNKKYLAGETISNLEVIHRAEKTFPDKSNILLLLTTPLDFPELDGFRLLYKVDKVFGYGSEKFYLYKSINKN